MARERSKERPRCWNLSPRPSSELSLITWRCSNVANYRSSNIPRYRAERDFKGDVMAWDMLPRRGPDVNNLGVADALVCLLPIQRERFCSKSFIDHVVPRSASFPVHSAVYFCPLSSHQLNTECPSIDGDVCMAARPLLSSFEVAQQHWSQVAADTTQYPGKATVSRHTCGVSSQAASIIQSCHNKTDLY